jgi:hypothetical protein
MKDALVTKKVCLWSLPPKALLVLLDAFGGPASQNVRSDRRITLTASAARPEAQLPHENRDIWFRDYASGSVGKETIGIPSQTRATPARACLLLRQERLWQADRSFSSIARLADAKGLQICPIETCSALQKSLNERMCRANQPEEIISIVLEFHKQ